MQLTVSIVSHGHGRMVESLVHQLLTCTEVGQILVTFNIPEKMELPDDPRIFTLNNSSPKGFGANHNAAFERCRSEFFVVLNPDVALIGNPFFALLNALNQSNGALVSPLALSSKGEAEDCWRYFPTPYGLLRRWLGFGDGRYSFIDKANFSVEWASGLCICFRSDAYAKLRGFDESYFLYFEDVDICVRAWKMGMRVLACPVAIVVHDGQRASRRSYVHMRWYFISMIRYFYKYWFRLPKAQVVNV